MPAKRKRKRFKPYSKGQLNKIIDAYLHPFYSENEAWRMLDVLLHGLLEQNPRVSLEKFIKYNLPDLVRKISKKK